jgi:hypothetical protein
MLIALCCTGTVSAQQKPANLPPIRVGNYTFNPVVIDKIITRKIKHYNDYTQILLDKKDNYKNAIELAMHLFNDNEETKVDITDRSGNHNIKKVRKYLTALSQLNYDKVTINDHDVIFVSNLVRQPDGTFTGVARCVQNFTAVKDGKVVFDDTVEKTFTIILKVWDEYVDGKIQEKCDIFLGNMAVTNILKA